MEITYTELVKSVIDKLDDNQFAQTLFDHLKIRDQFISL